MPATGIPASKIKQHVENLLRTCGHSVGEVYRVYSPGDLGSSDHEATTVLFCDRSKNPKRALVWREKVTKKKHPLAPDEVERVRVLSGWD